MLLTIKQFLDAATLQKLQQTVAAGEYTDGKVTAGSTARQVKNNLQLPHDSPAARAGDEILGDCMRRNGAFGMAAQPKQIAPALYARYEPGMAYGSHLDNPILNARGGMRSDVSVTVFLNGPEEYDGGELIIDTHFGITSVKANAGDLVLYPSTYVHRVAPVTRGTRWVAATWVQSMVRSVEQRKILFDLGAATGRLGNDYPDRPELVMLNRSYINLLRMWAEV